MAEHRRVIKMHLVFLCQAWRNSTFSVYQNRQLLATEFFGMKRSVKFQNFKVCQKGEMEQIPKMEEKCLLLCKNHSKILQAPKSEVRPTLSSSDDVRNFIPWYEIW